MMKSLNPIFPCDGCKDAEATGGERSSCQATGKPCWLLHKFLREDPECYQRSWSRELILSPAAVESIADWQGVTPTRITLQDLAEGTPGYWDIMNCRDILKSEKEIVLAFYTEGLSYKQIAELYKITVGTVQRLLSKARKRIRVNKGR